MINRRQPSNGKCVLRDADIRQPLHAWLEEQYADESDTRILHEVPIPRPSARIDIAVVNGELSGFEIKSDLDCLRRLPRQIRSFSTVFDRMVVVTTPRQLQAVRNSVPEWWGIYLAQNDGTFRLNRKGRTNRIPSCENLLYLLTKEELLDVQDACGEIYCRKTAKRVDIIGALLSNISSLAIRSVVRNVLKKRPCNFHVTHISSTGG